MSKKRARKELVNQLAKSLAHKIGSIVNNTKLYASKYTKEAAQLLEEAKEVARKEHWNSEDKQIIKENLKKNLTIELKKRDFLSDEKFSLVDQEIAVALSALNLLA